MKSIFFNLCLFSILYLSVVAKENPKVFRRSLSETEIKGKKHSFREEVGVPLMALSKPVMRTDISNIKETKKLADDAEEMGSGYDNIDGMEPDDEEQSGSSGSGNGDDGSGGVPDLNGDFPPNADQLKNLPMKDVELTPDEIDKKLADKRKGYFRFTIRQRFKPDFKYKESSAYKILAGNVVKDVEKAVTTRDVVKDVLFREAKNVGGPPYRSKVEVYLKLKKKVSAKRLKKIVDYGLINGMITIPGSFQANFV